MTGVPEVWSSFTYDPRDPRYAGLRASDADRSLVHQVLAEAYADGRLDRDEYDERCTRVTGIRALGDLRTLLDDLVAPPPTSTRSLAHASRRDLEVMAERAWRTRRREAVFSFLGASLISTAIWVATTFMGGDGFDPYFFWPAFVIAFSLLHMIRVATSHEENVQTELRRLEKRQAKEQRRGPFGSFG